MKGDPIGRLKRIATTVAAVSPLVLGAVTPAYGCKLVPANETAADRSPQLRGGADPLWGPKAPFDEMKKVDERAPGVECGAGCWAGSWRDTPAAGPTGGGQ